MNILYIIHAYLYTFTIQNAFTEHFCGVHIISLYSTWMSDRVTVSTKNATSSSSHDFLTVNMSSASHGECEFYATILANPPGEAKQFKCRGNVVIM